MRDTVINFVLFQIGWFACVLSSAAGQPVIGVTIAGAIIAFHLWRARQPQSELYLILTAMAIGTVWDSLLVGMALLDYSTGILIPNSAPYWIVVMWALFATTINVSLRWLKYKYGTAVLLGAIAGPLAYYGGARLGALNFIDMNLALLALAIGWAVFTPLLVSISRYLDGFPQLQVRA